MNRNDEWNQLIDDFTKESVPDTLDASVTQGIQKYNHRSKLNHVVIYPLAALCAAFAIFTASVNLFPAFATACSKIPVIKDLAEAVKFSPSLSAAVDNEYLQEMRLEQTQNNITMRVEYVIVDQSQLNIFYTLSSDVYHAMDGTPCIRSMDNYYLPVCIMSGGDTDLNTSLRHITVDFNTALMPNQLRFELAIRDNGSDQKTVEDTTEEQTTDDTAIENYEPEKYSIFDQEINTLPAPVTTFSFVLKFDPYYTAQGEAHPLSGTFTIGEQKFILRQYRLYPTYLCVDLGPADGNTQWLRSLDYYIEDEKGRKYESAGSIGSDATPGFTSFRVDSSYFTNAKHLTMYITKAYWMDKTNHFATLDLVNRTCMNLPEGVTLSYCEKYKNDYHIAFRIDSENETAMRQLLTNDYVSPDGTEGHISSWSYTRGGHIFSDLPMNDSKDAYYISFALYDYADQTVELQLSETGSTTLTEPIEITIK